MYIYMYICLEQNNLNNEERVPGSWVPGSQGPKFQGLGPTFTPYLDLLYLLMVKLDIISLWIVL